MKRVILKYNIKAEGITCLPMSPGTLVIKAGHYRGEFCMWADIPIPRPPERLHRYFEICNTGEIVRIEDRRYIDTVIVEDAAFHFFELEESAIPRA